MRMFILCVFGVIFALVTESAQAATGYIDNRGIQLSHAGVDQRKPSPFIQILTYVNPNSWESVSLDEDRKNCTNPVPVLKSAVALYQTDKLTSDALEKLVRKAGMPPICLMWVENSQYPEIDYPVLLSTSGYFVFNYGGAYISWDKIEHKIASFDTILLDPWSMVGIAPAGAMSKPTPPPVKPYVAPPVEFKTLKTRRRDPKEFLGGSASDKTTTGSID